MKASQELPPIRLSVRALVEFSIYPEDILPFSAALMEEGRVAHLARQQLSGADSEVPLQWEGEALGLPFHITGRMDLVERGDGLPVIEEIKLCRGDAPEAAVPAHRAQAVCYAYMLCLQEGLSGARIRVSYASLKGELVASFEEEHAFSALREAFFSLLRAYALWEKRLRRHRAARDESLEGLPFPYPAFRSGQREMAAQVYTAISRRKRLFAVMPTGTGKSAAVLYPALKALGKGLCSQVFCLTARTTARRAMEQEVARMQAQGLVLKALTLNAREKLCPMEEVRCDPEHCDRARGHYLRQEDALKGAMKVSPWDTEQVERLADRYNICPFEFSLALSTLADVVICDYNYAFDPRVRLQRVFDRPKGVSLLVDEAHNLPDRVRGMLSGELSGSKLVKLRRQAGAELGRGSRTYRRATALLHALREEEPDPGKLLGHTENLMAALRDVPGLRLEGGMVQDLLGFQDALRRQQAEAESYALLAAKDGKERRLTVLCLHFTPHLKRASAPLSGFICYSATLAPLDRMRDLLGGEEEDACFELPSPFPRENLLCLQVPLNTRYRAREEGAQALADALRAMHAGRSGKYIAFFPSYRYLQLLEPLLQDLPLLVQQSGMDEPQRHAFLARFTQDEEPLLALCVLGGIFAEGVDLPGLQLIGVCVVGVGLPQVGEEREAIRQRAAQEGLDGFDIAYRWPGMHKVLQAAGRLIRSETDRGVLLLCDERFGWSGYRELLPAHWEVRPVRTTSEVPKLLEHFWHRP